MKISVFINTLNEAKRIRTCLESVKWADEIVVVDMHSDDETVAICREYTDKVFLVDRLGYCEPARKFAAEKTTGSWILNLDADEMVTAALKAELLSIVQADQHDAVYIPRKNYFWGEEIKYSGCGLLQDRQLRFYRRDAVTFSGIIHAGIQINHGKRVIQISNEEAFLVHFSYISPTQYWEKLERYTTIEAKAMFEAGKEYTYKNALKDVWNAFYKRYIKKSQGYKDGQWGLIYCIWTAVYKLNAYAKYKLMKKYNTVEYVHEIEKVYADIATKTLNELATRKSSHEHRH